MLSNNALQVGAMDGGRESHAGSTDLAEKSFVRFPPSLESANPNEECPDYEIRFRRSNDEPLVLSDDVADFAAVQRATAERLHPIAWPGDGKARNQATE